MPTKTFTNVLVNQKHIKVEGDRATGAIIKELGGIPAANLLFRESPGPKDDEAIADGAEVELHNGDRFYDMPPGNFG